LRCVKIDNFILKVKLKDEGEQFSLELTAEKGMARQLPGIFGPKIIA
jgi:hypothetical protein